MAFYFPTSIAPSSISLLKMMGERGLPFLMGGAQILGKKRTPPPNSKTVHE